MWSGDNSFGGDLDDVEIYDVALTADQVAALVPPPVHRYSFNDNTRVEDTGSNPLDGTNTNAILVRAFFYFFRLFFIYFGRLAVLPHLYSMIPT